FASAVSDSITTPQFLKDPETLISSNVDFKLGFFSPPNSRNRYLGIWFNKKKNSDSSLEIIWVANRDNPVEGSSSMLSFSDEGDLQVIDEQKRIYWSSNASHKTNSSVAQLLNTGNLILLPKGSDSIIWQSFDHPTDSLLPGVKLTFNKSLYDTRTKFRSWKSSTDPSSGQFRLVSLPRDLPEFFIMDGDKPYWRTGPWNGYLYLGVPYINSEAASGINLDNHNNTVELSYESTYLSLFICLYNLNAMFIGSAANLHYVILKKNPFVEGFNPENITEWRKGNWTNGCVRRIELQCRATGTKEDKFLLMKEIKVPDYALWVLATPDDCHRKCTEKCSCLAYSYYSGIGCMLWDANLIDLQQYPADGANFYLRLAHSELPEKRSKETLKLAQWQNIIGAAISSNDFQDLPLFEFTKLENATDNFTEINKLGRGGFGIVYKGTLQDGQEVAVKRLSKLSGQGLTEFMTEVLVISKLQHRNLVRLLGCCVEGEEKLLVYEYMPNKSLDALLFDRLHQELRGWKTRFNIIQGICRGLLYLHRDSRLRIIHRDLKASNILLDDELNPKISDFGMAKIFKGKEDHADTNRVVGTYGYMSPEYAMEGRFSEKSDIFSFGVLLLEIVSGRRNSSFKEEESLNLIAHAWKLWNEGDIQSLIDPAVLESGFLDEILKSIQVALLCVQELPEDRPNISMVISMIDSDVPNLPRPKQPGFTQRSYAPRNQALQDENESASVNHATMFMSSWLKLLNIMKFASKSGIPNFLMHLKAAVYTFMLICCLYFEFAATVSDSITSPQFLKDPEALISSNGGFKLGFFSPPDSRNRYLGIWFNNKKNSNGSLEIVWVANRDNPVKDSSCMLKFSDDGNLRVIDEQNKIYWSSNVSHKANGSVAQLLNTGNLILLPKGSVLSFGRVSITPQIHLCQE
ncbi:hypothetical protein KSS87_019540, partial [Heliosperma pusillum]